MTIMNDRDQIRRQYPLPSLLPDPSKVSDVFRGERMEEICHPLYAHYRNRPDVLAGGNGFLCQTPEDSAGWIKADLLVAFGVIPNAIIGRNGYIIDEVGKPPDFILEIVPVRVLNDPVLMSEEDMFGEFRPDDLRLDYDYVRKRALCARYGVGEYWRFCEPVDEHQDYPLAGWQLVDGEYQPLKVSVFRHGELRGYSPRLELELCWNGQSLHWRQITGGRPLPDFRAMIDLRDDALKLWGDERERRVAAEYREFVANDRARRYEELLRHHGIEPNIEPTLDEQLDHWRKLEVRRRKASQ